MMNVFLNTYRLKLNSSNKKLEDFLSEIFACCLQYYPELLNALFVQLDLPVMEEGSYQVNTQSRFRKLEYDKTGKDIPDIVITLPDNSVLIIESKVGAWEGTDQLKRYAEQINAKFGKGTLLYLTKNYDPKTEDLSWDNDLSNVKFKQCRWFDIYQLASKYKHHLLINQMLEFMIHENISSDNKFSPVDIIALNNFSRVKRIIDETMRGEVLTELIKIAPQSGKISQPMTQLKHHDRYNYIHYQKNHVWVGLGYWMNSFNEDEEYPDLKFVVEVSPDSPKYEEVIKTMSTIVAENSGTWHGKNLNNVRDWAQIYQRKSLKDFLAKENHVEAIRQYFLEAIKNYAIVKDAYFRELI